MWEYVQFWFAKQLTELVIFITIVLFALLGFLIVVLKDIYKANYSKLARIYKNAIIRELGSIPRGETMDIERLSCLVTKSRFGHNVFGYTKTKNMKLTTFHTQLRYWVKNGRVGRDNRGGYFLKYNES